MADYSFTATMATNADHRGKELAGHSESTHLYLASNLDDLDKQISLS